MTQPGSARALRVSDAERRHVVGLLEQATGHGFIDLDEFTARVDLALAARTRAELNAVLVDLPGLVHPERPAAAPVPATTPVPRATERPPAPSGDGTELRADLGWVSKRGAWEVPERIVLRSVMGSSELDFTETTVAHEAVHIHLDVTGGAVELRVPAESRVEHDELSVVLGSYTDRRRAAVGGGAPRFVLSGDVRAGSVDVRGPHRARWWRRRTSS